MSNRKGSCCVRRELGLQHPIHFRQKYVHTFVAAISYIPYFLFTDIHLSRPFKFSFLQTYNIYRILVPDIILSFTCNIYKKYSYTCRGSLNSFIKYPNDSLLYIFKWECIKCYMYHYIHNAKYIIHKNLSHRTIEQCCSYFKRIKINGSFE